MSCDVYPAPAAWFDKMYRRHDIGLLIDSQQTMKHGHDAVDQLTQLVSPLGRQPLTRQIVGNLVTCNGEQDMTCYCTSE